MITEELINGLIDISTRLVQTMRKLDETKSELTALVHEHMEEHGLTEQELDKLFVENETLKVLNEESKEIYSKYL